MAHRWVIWLLLAGAHTTGGARRTIYNEYSHNITLRSPGCLGLAATTATHSSSKVHLVQGNIWFAHFNPHHNPQHQAPAVIDGDPELEPKLVVPPEWVSDDLLNHTTKDTCTRRHTHTAVDSYVVPDRFHVMLVRMQRSMHVQFHHHKAELPTKHSSWDRSAKTLHLI